MKENRQPRLEVDEQENPRYVYPSKDKLNNYELVYDIRKDHLSLDGVTMPSHPKFRDFKEFISWCDDFDPDSIHKTTKNHSDNRVTVTIRVLPETKDRLNLLKNKEGIFIGREIDRMVKEICHRHGLE